MPPPPDDRTPSTPGLGPHCVGMRVVVRRLVRGERGPTGGPAMTDLLGVMETWTPTSTTVRAEDGGLTEIPLGDIVSGKPVPPRPSVRDRVSAEEAEVRAVATWPPTETATVGDWLLRAAGGWTGRANSALLVGEPDRPWDEALAEVVRFYRARDLPVRAQVVVGSAQDAALVASGWRPLFTDEVSFLLGGVAAASRAVRRVAGPAGTHVDVDGEPPPGWPTEPAPEAAHAVLVGPDQVCFAHVELDGRTVARGRAALDDRPDPWVGITGLWVDPARRRRGLGLAVMRELLGWAAERGATTAFLQVLDSNEAALGLYRRLGFAEHHRYRYLTPP